MNFPIDAVRERFPALELRDEGMPRIYFDNPAGTQVPRSVADAAARCLLETNANLGGFFPTSVAAEQIVERSHRAMAHFLGAESFREIVAGPSMTALTFSIARSLARRFAPGDEIVVTRMDHDGNIAPWLTAAEDRGLVVRWVPFDERTWRIEPAEVERVLSSKTRLVALNYASNLTGSINDVRDLVRRVHAAGALAYVDAVQLAPHRLIDVRALECDFLTCSPYKFFGPHLGVLWARKALLEDLYAYKVRPQTAQLPWKFEVGTPPIEALAALEATVAYFEWLGSIFESDSAPRSRIAAAFDAIEPWERDLTRSLLEGLARIRGVRILGPAAGDRAHPRVPTVSLVHERHSPIVLAQHLAAANVFVWSGHNFALETVRQLGIDEEAGVLRIGLAHYNTPGEIATCLDVLEAAAAA